MYVKCQNNKRKISWLLWREYTLISWRVSWRLFPGGPKVSRVINATVPLITARQRSCGKVMLSLEFVSSKGGGICEHYQHALDLTVQAPSPAPHPSPSYPTIRYGTPLPLLVTSGFFYRLYNIDLNSTSIFSDTDGLVWKSPTLQLPANLCVR